MNQDLRDAFDRWLAANNAVDALTVLIEICQLMHMLAPTFECPFAESDTPTISQQWGYVSLWQAQNNSGVFGSGGD